MRKILATTALCLTMATGAHAAAHSEGFMTSSEVTDVMGSDFIGMRIYTSDFDMADFESMRVQGTTLMSGEVERDWNSIGEVHDLLLSREGELKAVLVDVGGFLGMGEKTVAVTMDQINFVPEDGVMNSYFLVINSTEEKLEAAPAFEMAQMENDVMETSETLAATDVRTFPSEDFSVDGYEAVEIGSLTAEELDGARVFGIDDSDVGEISSLLLTDDGKIDAAVIDVGGFLGLGEKPVKVSFDRLSVQRADGGVGIVRVYIDSSQEALEQLPDYNG